MYDPEKHHRRSIRLKGYDYSRIGAYFVTLCTHQRQCIFGEIIDHSMTHNEIGQIVVEEWSKSMEIRNEITLDEWIVMPNHIHGIVIIANDIVVGATGRSPLRISEKPGPSQRSLGSFIAGFKSSATHRINVIRNTPGTPVWQRNYYEHVVRNEAVLQEIRDYIRTNPLQWASDAENPLMVDLR